MKKGPVWLSLPFWIALAVMPVLFTVYSPAQADSADSAGFMVSTGDKTLPDTEGRKTVKGLSVCLAIVDDPDFMNAWDATARLSEYRPMKKTRKGGYFGITAVFSRPGSRAGEPADLRYDITVLKPDGTLYGQNSNLVLWNSRDSEQPDPGPDEPCLAEEHMMVQIETGDPAGIYTVKSTVRSGNAGPVMELLGRFTVE